MNLTPLQDRIVVKRIEGQGSTRIGIAIPGSAKEKPQEGEVVAINRGKRLQDGNPAHLAVKLGDRVLFGKHSGTVTTLACANYLILREDDILSILDAAPGTGAAA